MNASNQTDPPVSTTAPLALWRIAEAFMHTLFGLFGAPEDVAESHTLLKRPYQLMCIWLRVAEALMRRLLLIEAAALPLAKTPPRPWPSRQRLRQLRYFFPDKPQDWRVSFRCFRSLTLRQAHGDAVCAAAPVSVSLSLSKAKRPEPKRFFSAWPLAERYEALLRVFNDPVPFARRLAKRLHAGPHRLREIMRAPPDAHHKIGDEEWASINTEIETRWALSDSS